MSKGGEHEEQGNLILILKYRMLCCTLHSIRYELRVVTCPQTCSVKQHTNKIAQEHLWKTRVHKLCSQIMKNLKHGGKRPGLGFTAKRAVLAILISELWQSLPGWPEEQKTDISDPDYMATLCRFDLHVQHNGIEIAHFSFKLNEEQ